MIKENKKIGFLSFIIGMLSIILIINWFDLYPNFLPLILGVFAIIFSLIACKKDDKYGKYGKILGIISTVIGLLQVMAWYVYVYTSSLL